MRQLVAYPQLTILLPKRKKENGVKVPSLFRFISVETNGEFYDKPKLLSIKS